MDYKTKTILHHTNKKRLSRYSYLQKHREGEKAVHVKRGVKKPSQREINFIHSHLKMEEAGNKLREVRSPSYKVV